MAKQAGVPYPTLYTWIKMRKKVKTVKSSNDTMRSKDKTSEAKLQAVFDTIQMTKEEQSAYCRKHGFYIYYYSSDVKLI